MENTKQILKQIVERIEEKKVHKEQLNTFEIGIHTGINEALIIIREMQFKIKAYELLKGKTER